MAENHPSRQPQKTDHYLLWWNVIGSGTFGEVWEAEWKEERNTKKKSYRKCAIKKLKVATDKQRNMLVREVSVWRNLQQDNIVEFYEEFATENNYCIAMEYIENGSLETFMQKQGAHSVDLSLVLTFGLDVCKAVQYLHSKNIIHRDIKPGNLLLGKPTNSDKTINLKLCDYGLAREFTEIDFLSACGTKLYMAPEFIKHKSKMILRKPAERFKGPFSTVHLSKLVDIYSIGVLLNELPTFRYPFDDFEDRTVPRLRGEGWSKKDINGLNLKLANATSMSYFRPTKAITINNATPESYQQLVIDCWAHSREMRPKIDEVLEHLEQIKDTCEANGTIPKKSDIVLSSQGFPSTIPKNESELKTGGQTFQSGAPPKPEIREPKPIQRKRKSIFARLFKCLQTTSHEDGF